MKILYDENEVSTIDLSDNDTAEDELIKFHILMFRFMQALSEKYGISLDQARTFCTMNDEQFNMMIRAEMVLGLSKEDQ